MGDGDRGDIGMATSSRPSRSIRANDPNSAGSTRRAVGQDQNHPPFLQKQNVMMQQSQQLRQHQQEANNDDDSDCTSDDEWLNELESDPALEEIRVHRLEQLRQEQLRNMELKSRGHGDYRTISQDEFLPETTTCASAGALVSSSLSKSSSPEWVVVHFFHDEFMKCKVMDHHLKIVAEKHLECKFLRIEAQKAPFFCTKLKVVTLPTVLVLQNGIVVNRLVGFEGIADGNEWPTRLLQAWLGKSGAIQHTTPTSREIDEEMQRLGITTVHQKGTIRRGGVRHYDDDDNE